MDGRPTYPASYSLPNVVAVAAIDRAGALAGFSNYGSRTCHLGAPGVGGGPSSRSHLVLACLPACSDPAMHRCCIHAVGGASIHPVPATWPAAQAAADAAAA